MFSIHYFVNELHNLKKSANYRVYKCLSLSSLIICSWMIK